MGTGRNQHYIPRFLLRPFEVPGKAKHVWRFDLKHGPVLMPTSHAGSEKYFYSRPTAGGQPTLDDAISKTESKLSQMLRDVRSRTPGERVDPVVAAQIVSHIFSRTAHVRSSFEDGVVHLLEDFKALFADYRSVEKALGLDAGRPTARFRDVIVDELTRNPEIARLGIPREVLERMVFVILREAPKDILGATLESTAIVLNEVRAQLGETVRQGHNKALGQPAGSNAYEVLLKNFEWRVESAPDDGAILPDCVVLAFAEHRNASTLLIVGGKALRAVVMAVSPDTLLVGYRPGFELPTNLNYNLEAARLSHSFFLSHRKDDEMSRLIGEIGKRLRCEIEASIGAAFRGTILDTDRGGPGTSASYGDSFEWRPTSMVNYELSISGCGNDARVNNIHRALEALVNVVARAVPLGRLDGITVASNYPVALSTVDRGFDTSPVLETVPAGIERGVAKTVVVKRSDAIKGHVVLSDSLCCALLADDATSVNWAIHVLARLLVGVAMIGIVDETLPGTLLAPVGREMDGWLYALVDGVPEAYVASRKAAEFCDDREIGNGLRELLICSLDRLRTVAGEERLAFCSHGDVAKLLAFVQPAVSHVLGFAADLLGHCSFSRESPFDHSRKLDEALDRLGLQRWFKAYERDLEYFFARLGKWKSFDEFLVFNLHVERLLWSVGIFSWEGPDGLVVDVCPDWDPRSLDGWRAA